MSGVLERIQESRLAEHGIEPAARRVGGPGILDEKAVHVVPTAADRARWGPRRCLATKVDKRSVPPGQYDPPPVSAPGADAGAVPGEDRT
jgi:hypothetical protein